MCRSTTETQPAAKNTVLDIPQNTVPKLPDVPLQSYLAKAYEDALKAGRLGKHKNDSVQKLHVPFAICAHRSSGEEPEGPFYAGVHDDEMHFSASLLKVAAMYAAYSLRAEARQLAKSGNFSDQNAFFTALGQQFKSTDAVPAIQNAGVGLKPKYPDILKVTGFGGGGPLTVEFNPGFSASLTDDQDLFEKYQDVHAQQVSNNKIKEDEENGTTLAALGKVSHMYRMIVPSNNQSAGECIRRLGYAYLNVKLMNGGFFDKTTDNGIWLAADYIQGPKVTINSVNDGQAGQVTTARQIARLFSLIQRGKLIDVPSSTKMRELLEEANTEDESWLILDFDRKNPVSRKFTVIGVKIGLANLKPNTPPLGDDVYSEGIIIHWKKNAKERAEIGLNGDFTVCWQNLRALKAGTFDGIAEVIENALLNFIMQNPLQP